MPLNTVRTWKFAAVALIPMLLVSYSHGSLRDSQGPSREVRRRTIDLQAGEEMNRPGQQRFAKKEDGLWDVMRASFLDATSYASSTETHITKCRHPETGDTVHLVCEQSSRSGKKASKRSVTCAPTAKSSPPPTRSKAPSGFPTSSPTGTTNKPSPHPSPNPTRRKTSSPIGKRNGTKESKDHEKKKKSEKNSKAVRQKIGDEAVATDVKSGKKTKYNLEDLPICTDDQLNSGGGAGSESPSLAPTQAKITYVPTMSPVTSTKTVTDPTESPVTSTTTVTEPSRSPVTSTTAVTEPTRFPVTSTTTKSPVTSTTTLNALCVSLSQGTGVAGAFSTTFVVRGVLFADKALNSVHYSNFWTFLQQGLAPMSAGCPTSFASLPFSVTRRLSSVMSTIKVEAFSQETTGIGSECGVNPTDMSDNCASGSIVIEATGDDQDSVTQFPVTFLQEIKDSITGNTLALMGLTEVGGLILLSNDAGNGGENVTEDGTGGGGEGGGGGTLTSGRGSSVAAAETDNTITPNNGSPAPVSVFLVVVAGIGLFAVIMLAVSRKRKPSLAASLKHLQMKDDDDDDTSLFGGDAASAASPKVFAHVVGEDSDDSIFGGIERVMSADKDGSVTDESSDDGLPMQLDHDEVHPVGEMCSSPSCLQCEETRRKSTVRFISVNDNKAITHPPNHVLGERKYYADDTVDL